MRLSLKVRMTKWKNVRTVKTALYFWNCCNCSKIGRNILKNLEFLSFGILIVQICNKIPGLLRFKFSKLTYRKKDWQVPTSSMRPFCSVSDPMFTCARLERLLVSVWLGTQFWLVLLTQFSLTFCHWGKSNIWK